VEDRELLELAAKAAGLKNALFYNEDDGKGWYAKTGKREYWRPLTDDGDALRLAVKLRIDIRQFAQDDGRVSCLVDRLGYGWGEAVGDDPYAATRRAIVRAAAEIWRAAS